MAVYIRPGSVKSIKSASVGVGGSVKSVKSIYVGVGAVAKKVWPVAEYGTTVDLLSYGKKTLMYTYGRVISGSSNSSLTYLLRYTSGGSIIQRATVDKYNLTNYNYIVIMCNISGTINASYRVSLGTSSSGQMQNDSIKGTSGAMVLGTSKYTFLVDISKITGSFYIKNGLWVSGASGTIGFCSSYMRMYIDKPSVTANKTLTFTN